LAVYGFPYYDYIRGYSSKADNFLKKAQTSPAGKNVFAVLPSRIPENLPCAAVSRIFVIGALAAYLRVLASLRLTVFRSDGHSIFKVLLSST